MNLLTLPFYKEIESIYNLIEYKPAKEFTDITYFMLLSSIIISITLLIITIKFFFTYILDIITSRKEYNNAIILGKYTDKFNTPILSIQLLNKTYNMEIYECDIDKFNELNTNDEINVETTIGGFTKSIIKLKLI